MGEELAKKIATLGVWELNPEYHTVTLAYEYVTVEKTKTVKLKSGEEKQITKEDHIRIPIRYYNLQYALDERDEDWKQAVSSFQFGPTIYLPREKGYSSYKMLLDDAFAKRLERAELLN